MYNNSNSSPRRPQHRKLSYLIGGPSALDDDSAGHRIGVNSIAVDDFNSMLTAGRDTTVRRWSTGATHKCVETVRDHVDCVNDVCYANINDDRRAFVSCSADHTVVLHCRGESIVSALHTDAVKRIRCVGSSLYSAGLDGILIALDMEKNLHGVRSYRLGRPLTALSTAPDNGSVIVTGCAEGAIHLVDTRAPVEQCIRHKGNHTSTIKDLLFTGPTTILSAGADGVVRLWDTRSSRYEFHAVLHSDAVFALAAVDSKMFLSAGRDGTVAATNVATLMTSTVVVENNPIHCIAVGRSGLLYTGGPLSAVNAYSMMQIMNPDLSMSMSTTDDGSVSPSRIEVQIDDAPKVENLTCIEPRKYASPLVREVPFETKEQRQAWSSARFSLRPQHRDPLSMSKPVHVLPHQRGAFVDCAVLPDKRHVVALDDCGEYSLWNLITRQRVATIPAAVDAPLKDVLAKIAIHSSCPKWCAVDCRWGAICVTMSQEEAFCAISSQWDLERTPLVATSDNNTSSSNGSGAATSGVKLSTYSMTPTQRRLYRKKDFLNVGATALIFLVEKAGENDTVVIWATKAHQTPTDTTNCHRIKICHHEQLEGSQLPSWVQAALEGQGTAPPASALRNINVELLPCEGPDTPSDVALPALKKGRTIAAYEPFSTVGRLAEDIVKELNLTAKLPDRLATLQKIGSGNSKSANSFTTDSAVDVIVADEFIELLSHDESAVLDPLMTLGTAVMMHKRKGDRVDQLVVRYRKNLLLRGL